jgi:hypothetical protein
MLPCGFISTMPDLYNHIKHEIQHKQRLTYEHANVQYRLYVLGRKDRRGRARSPEGKRQKPSQSMF